MRTKHTVNFAAGAAFIRTQRRRRKLEKKKAWCVSSCSKGSALVAGNNKAPAKSLVSLLSLSKSNLFSFQPTTTTMTATRKQARATHTQNTTSTTTAVVVVVVALAN